MFEQVYLEFVGQAALDFGGWRNPLAFDQGLNYHWLSYAWMMTFSDLLDLDRFEALASIGPVLISFGTVACAAGLAHRIGGRRALWWALPALAWFDTARVWSWGGHVGQVQSQSQFLANAMLLCMALVMLQYLTSPSRRCAGLLFVLSAALMLTKSSHALILLGVLLGAAYVVRERGLPVGRLVVLWTSVLLGLSTTYLAFLSGDVRHRLMPSWMTFAWEMRGDLRDWAGREPWYSIAALALLCGSAGHVALILLAARPSPSTRATTAAPMAWGAVLLGVLGTSILDSSGVDSSQMYFVTAPAGLALVLAVSGLSIDQSIPRGWSLAALVVWGFAVTLLLVVVPLPSSGSPVAIGLRLLPLVAPVVVFATAIPITFGFPPEWRRSLIIAALVASSVSMFVFNVVTSASSQFIERRNEVGQFDGRYSRVGAWVRVNTQWDSRGASNFFCGQSECEGEAWFDSLKADVIPHRIGPRESLEIGGVRFGAVELAAATRRQFLIQGYAWLWTYGDPPGWLERRVELSVGFANSPSEEERQRLLDEGVDWFVVDLRRTDNRRWLPTTPIVYDDGEFLVLRLTDPPTT